MSAVSKAQKFHLFSDEDESRLQLQAGSGSTLQFEDTATGILLDVQISKLTVEEGVNVAEKLISLNVADHAQTVRAQAAESGLTTFINTQVSSERARAPSPLC
jgi:hypothetical protein